ncbi:MAG TPA: SIMPL domain-containing protein [Edaphocola sp.]|nr:SIMPL domain-containing protein [Edaphocola sp.]
MENKPESKSIFIGIAILTGLSLLGFFIYKGLKTFSDKDRIVTVKGLAEMNMTATAASITMSYSFSGDDLQDLIKQTENKMNAIVVYLKTQGFEDNSISIKNISINDRQKYYESQWVDGKQVEVKINRYTITQNISLPSKDVKATEDLASRIALDLISKDLTTTIKSEYIFPELNAIKPQLIAESTKNARIAGEQFANDSKAKLGKIKTAAQGQITLAGQYSYDEEMSGNNEKPKEPYIQKARVVSTIVFFLE